MLFYYWYFKWVGFSSKFIEKYLVNAGRIFLNKIWYRETNSYYDTGLLENFEWILQGPRYLSLAPS